MSEQNWTTTPVPVLPVPMRKHTAIIDGLRAEIREEGFLWWSVSGFLADVAVSAGNHIWRGTLDDAKVAVANAAHRLHAAGVRGAIGYPVGCCERLFVTRDAADQHEVEHLAAQEGEADAVALGIDSPS